MNSNSQLEQARLIGRLSGSAVVTSESFGSTVSRGFIDEVSFEPFKDVAETVNSSYRIRFYIDTKQATPLRSSDHPESLFATIVNSIDCVLSRDEVSRNRRIKLPLIRSKYPGKIHLTNAQIEELLE